MHYATFEERQGFAPWVHGIVLVGLPIIFVVQWATASIGRPHLWWLGAALLLLTAFILNLLRLRVRVEEEYVRVRLGWWFPLFWRSLPLAKIQEVRPITYRPIRDAGGWGLRFGRFEGRFCQYWNARGNRGVLVVLTDGLVVLGSQEPDALAEAIRNAMAAPGQGGV